jgi:hypothetical protein
MLATILLAGVAVTAPIVGFGMAAMPERGEAAPRKIAGPWQLAVNHSTGLATWLRPCVSPRPTNDTGERLFTGAVTSSRGDIPVLWLAYDEIGDGDGKDIGDVLAMGEAESEAAGKTLVDAHLLAVGWTLQL